MAFLTRLLPNLRSRRVRTSLANPYELHRDVMSAFPDAGPNIAGRSHYNVLHRLDVLPTATAFSPRLALLIQSSVEPQWTQLPRDESGQPWISSDPQIKPFDPDPNWFRHDQLLRFRVRANPTKRLRKGSVDPKGKPIEAEWIGKRVEIHDHDAQKQWLSRKSGSHGFRLVEVEASPQRELQVFDLLDRPEGKTIAHKSRNELPSMVITHAAVTFDGVLRVADSEAFCAALLKGIGPAKAFGFGLLSIAPVNAPVR